MRIPLDRRIAEAYSEGIAPVKALPEYQEQFHDLYERIVEGVALMKQQETEEVA